MREIFVFGSKETMVFNVVAVGCGLAAYKPEQIAPMFKASSWNVRLPQEFLDILTK